MCLFLTIETTDSGASRTSVKRVLKGASTLSAYPADVEDRQLWYISNEPGCACDLHVAGPDALGAGIELDRGACESLQNIAGALASAGVVPFEFRAFWAENPHPSFTQVTGVTDPFDPNNRSNQFSLFGWLLVEDAAVATWQALDHTARRFPVTAMSVHSGM